jgi:hypothetical protein
MFVYFLFFLQFVPQYYYLKLPVPNVVQFFQKFETTTNHNEPHRRIIVKFLLVLFFDFKCLHNMIVNLPKYCCLNVVTKWITLDELTKLDTSICSSRMRNIFLENISGMVFFGYKPQLKEGFTGGYSCLEMTHMEHSTIIAVVNWLKLRNLKTDHILLTNESLNYALDNLSFESITSVCFSMSSLVTKNVKVISDPSITQFINGCPNLTILNVSQSGLILSESGLQRIIKYYSMQLVILVVGFNSTLSTKLIILSIAENQKSLTSLHISASKFIDDGDIELICKNCSGLTCLDISQNPRLTVGGALFIVNRLFQLRTITFEQKSSKISGDMFMVLRRGFSKIFWLDLRRSSAFGLPLSERLELTVEDVMKEIVASKLHGIGSDMFNLKEKRHFLPACYNLERVSMPNNVCGSSLDTFFWYCSSHIKELNLQGHTSTVVGPLDPSTDIVDSSLYVIAARCSSLEVVNFSFRECITDDGMIALVTANSNLRQLHCVSCSNIGSGTLFALAQSCSNLEVLNVSGCRSLMDDCLIAVAEGCRHLEHVGLKSLDVESTNAVTMTSMKMLVSKCECLQNILRSPPNKSYSRTKKFYLRSFGESNFIYELELT